MVGILRRSRAHTLAVVDIASGHVGCSIISYGADGPGTVIAEARSFLSLEERSVEQARARIAEEIAQACKAAREKAGASHPGMHVPLVYAVVHAPWTSSKVLSARTVFDEETVVRDLAITRLAQEALAHAEIDRTRVMEAAVLSVHLNGYPTLVPDGKHAREAEVAVMVSAADTALTASAETAIQAAFPSAKILWRSAARMHVSTLQLLKKHPEALVVEVGVLATHLIVLSDGMPVAERVISEGLRTILMRVHGERPPAEVLGLFRMLSRDACADDACLMLQRAVAAAEPELVRVFGEAFSMLAQERHVPNTLVLVAHEDIAAWLGNFFARIDFAQFTATTLPFSVVVMNAALVSPWISSEANSDTMLALVAARAVADEQST